ncbi:hypothetical protein [Caulobacter segnis]
MSKLSAQLAQLERQQNEDEARKSRDRQAREAVEAGRKETMSLRRFRGDLIEEPAAKRGE